MFGNGSGIFYMVSGQPKPKKNIISRLFNLINPLRDPSFTVAVVLTFIWATGSNPRTYLIPIVFALAWLAVKSAVWFFINILFSFGFIMRKTWWVFRNPRLAWRLVDALGTEEIIIGGLYPEMFVNGEGGLQEAQFARQYQQNYQAPPAYTYNAYEQYSQDINPEMLNELENLRMTVRAYEQLVYDWTHFTEEKWRAVSDSQLGWKPLRGRWNSWDEIFTDSYGARTSEQMSTAALAASEALRQRFDSARARGSAASSVACFLHDLDLLRQNFNAVFPDNAQAGYTDNSAYVSQNNPPPSVTRTGKTPIIRDPMRIIDAN